MISNLMNFVGGSLSFVLPPLFVDDNPTNSVVSCPFFSGVQVVGKKMMTQLHLGDDAWMFCSHLVYFEQMIQIISWGMLRMWNSSFSSRKLANPSPTSPRWWISRFHLCWTFSFTPRSLSKKTTHRLDADWDVGLKIHFWLGRIGIFGIPSIWKWNHSYHWVTELVGKKGQLSSWPDMRDQQKVDNCKTEPDSITDTFFFQGF